MSWAQRLGYLLEQVGGSEKAVALKSHVQATARDMVPLLSGASRAVTHRDTDWKLLVNIDLEPEL